MSYESITLTQEICIDRIISIHYFEYRSDFSFAGESHNFWEFLCVDKGTVHVLAGETRHKLSRGDIIFHAPNEFHDVHADGVTAPNLVVISFDCASPAMEFFRGKILHADTASQKLLGALLQEASLAFASRLDDPYCEKLIRRPDAPFGSEQLIQTYLQQFFIGLLRSVPTAVPQSAPETTPFSQLTAYLEAHLNGPLSVERICRDTLLSRSQLQKLVKRETGNGVMDYFSALKINAAKQLLRDGQQNISQIADALGYSSVPYFSRQFKQRTGMTPTEYTTSIRRLCEPPCH